jgi:hypothetical protein
MPQPIQIPKDCSPLGSPEMNAVALKNVDEAIRMCNRTVQILDSTTEW